MNFPNAEICDGQDNNCNGTPDELGALGSQVGLQIWTVMDLRQMVPS